MRRAASFLKEAGTAVNSRTATIKRRGSYSNNGEHRNRKSTSNGGAAIVAAAAAGAVVGVPAVAVAFGSKETEEEKEKEQGNKQLRLRRKWSRMQARSPLIVGAECEALKAKTEAGGGGGGGKSSSSSSGGAVSSPVLDFFSSLATRGTVDQIESTSSRDSLHSKYTVDWETPLGEGSFGAVYLATDRLTGEKFAVKRMSKECANDVSFQREIKALLRIRANGSHPYICTLRENFDEGDNYYLVFDLVSGGELFDHLVGYGAYSEKDAARLMREVASALAFLHGIGIVHCDLKPENIMLSTSNRNAAIKIVDFGCADVVTEEDHFSAHSERSGTVAFCPPEVLDTSNPDRKQRDASFDMWSLGIILYIMLTGVHPFDLQGDATDTVLEHRIKKQRGKPPLRNSPYTAHLSDSAIDCIERLMASNPDDRMSSIEMLYHPWVKGQTAQREKMIGMDKKLSAFRKLRDRLEARVFANLVSWSKHEDSSSSNLSLLERNFQSFDTDQTGQITLKDLQKGIGHERGGFHVSSSSSSSGMADATISMSEFDELLSKNMRSHFFPKDHVIYREGDSGDNMFFINSGTVEVSTEKGFNIQLKQGDFFGEGALLNPDQTRYATIRCATPVHVIEITEEKFDDYLRSPESLKSRLMVEIRERDMSRKIDMAKSILTKQVQNEPPIQIAQNDPIYNEGGKTEGIYMVDRGKVEVRAQNTTVSIFLPGDFFGIGAVINKHPRRTSAHCIHSEGCSIRKLQCSDFYNLMASSPVLEESLRDFWHRRRFRQAVVNKTKRHPPVLASEEKLRETFDACCREEIETDSSTKTKRMKKRGTISREAVRNLLKKMDPDAPDEEIIDITNALDLDSSGEIDYDEFKKVFSSNQ